MLTMNKDTVINDFNWVIKILDSSSNKEHMDISLKCFNLWENKHVDKSLSKSDKKVITELKGKFWVKFKKKFIKFGTFNV